MITTDTCVSVAPYFKVHTNKMEPFKQLCIDFVNLSSHEPNCLYYGFSFHEDIAHCREGFKNAQALLDHIENLKPVVAKMTQLADLIKIEVHGVETELAKLREPLKDMKPDFFVLLYGFRN